MKVQLTLIFLLFIFAACRTEQKTCHLNGILKNAPDTTTLFLADWESRKLFDSIKIVNGQIDYEFNLNHPKKFYLHNRRNQYPFRDRKFIWLEPSEVSINGDFEFFKNLEVNGSRSQTEFENYNLLVDNATKKINELKEQIHFKSEEEKKKDTTKIELLQTNLSDSIVAFMLKYPNSFVTLNTLHDECYLALRHLKKSQINEVYENLTKELKKSNKGIEIKKYIDLPEPPRVGDLAPEIVQTTPNGETVKLSDYRGKYVLVDFWASWCGPCRGSHKWLRRIYKKYNPKGFEILSVSSDTDKNRWSNTIKEDSILWTNISDLKGWENEAFLLYDVKYIPQNFLINPDGEIIKWNINSEKGAEYELGKIFEPGKKPIVSERRNHVSQERSAAKFPISVELTSFDGKQFNTSNFSNDNQMIFIDFWYLGCSPCMQFFDAVRDNNEKWEFMTNCKIIAIACQERDNKIIEVVESNNWPLEVYFDPDYKLFEALCRLHDKNDMQFSFPTFFVFDEKWQLLNKLNGAKRKLKSGVKPGPNKNITANDFVVDLEAYYAMFREWEERK